MTTQEKLTKIDSVIREVCSELVHEAEREGDTGYYGRIELQHILRAIQTREGYEYLEKDRFLDSMIGYWSPERRFDLTLPLHLQSDEFISRRYVF